MKRKEIIITVLMLAAFSIMGIIMFSDIGAETKYAVVRLNGDEVMRRSVEKEGKFVCKEIDGMEFEITGGGVRVVSSACPDKICVKTGIVTAEGFSAVCLPNKVTVTIETN